MVFNSEEWIFYDKNESYNLAVGGGKKGVMVWSKWEGGATNKEMKHGTLEIKK